MAIRTFSPVYHTVEHKNEESSRMKNPIFGDVDPWLGEGYYFWDGFIELAQWWAKKMKYPQACIYEASIEVEESDMLDLVGNTSDMRAFRDFTKILKRKKPNEKITVLKVITLMVRELSHKYKLIRARTEHKLPVDDNKVPFKENRNEYMVSMPAIQMCATTLDLVKDFKFLTNYIQVKREPSEWVTRNNPRR